MEHFDFVVIGGGIAGIAVGAELVKRGRVLVLSRWAGLRIFAPDRSPVIGHATDTEGFVWYAALGGYGIQTAPAMARFCGRSFSMYAANFWRGARLPPRTSRRPHIGRPRRRRAPRRKTHGRSNSVPERAGDGSMSAPAQSTFSHTVKQRVLRRLFVRQDTMAGCLP